MSLPLWLVSINQTVWRPRQEDQNFKVILKRLFSLGLTWTCKTLSLKNKKQNKPNPKPTKQTDTMNERMNK